LPLIAVSRFRIVCLIKLTENRLPPQQGFRWIGLYKFALCEDYNAVISINEIKAVKHRNNCLVPELGFDHLLHDSLSLLVNTVAKGQK